MSITFTIAGRAVRPTRTPRLPPPPPSVSVCTCRKKSVPAVLPRSTLASETCRRYLAVGSFGSAILETRRTTATSVPCRCHPVPRRPTLPTAPSTTRKLPLPAALESSAVVSSTASSDLGRMATSARTWLRMAAAGLDRRQWTRPSLTSYPATNCCGLRRLFATSPARARAAAFASRASLVADPLQLLMPRLVAMAPAAVAALLLRHRPLCRCARRSRPQVAITTFVAPASRPGRPT
mmetsp:Transcript_7265/g.16189  ORF Transcript_7265/g.16189 Transcript_7265/m.16189 type:complete len:237 (+) Transcript_7265:730-1440(+)